jgi:sugar transferase (PEP-CTERM/EpsH1 system associated)
LEPLERTPDAQPAWSDRCWHRHVRVLFLSQRVPFPPDRGDRIPTSWIVRWLARRHQVTCIAFAQGEDDLEGARALEAQGIPTVAIPVNTTIARLRSIPLLLGTRPLTLGLLGSRALQREVDRRIASSDLAFAFSSSMGAFLLPHHRVARIMHFADLDSDKWRQYASYTHPPMSWIFRREWRTLERFERTVGRTFDASLFCTRLEQEQFRERVPEADSSVLPNGVDLDYFRPCRDEAGSSDLVFTGVMDYFPNVDACQYFAQEVLPRVRVRHPDARFTIVGSRPSPAIRRLSAIAGVTVTGRVPDTRPYLRRAAVFVAPLRIARGVQNKVLEAMAMGLPVVATRAATQGIEGTPDGTYLVADSADAQAEAIGRLLTDPTRARALGEAGRRFVEAHHRWDSCLSRLDHVIARVLAQHAVRRGEAV